MNPLHRPGQPTDPWRHRLIVAAFILMAVAATQMGLGFCYGTQLFLGSAVVVLALLLLGDRGTLVGLAACSLVPRLWSEPMLLLLALGELIWLKLYLDYSGDPVSRRDNGWIVLADIAYWMVVGVPLAFLMFGVVLNMDPDSVLNLAILQGVNGSLNAIIAFLAYVLIRFHQARQDSRKSLPVHGVLLISLLSAIVLPSFLVLTISTRQLNQYSLDSKLRRMIQTAQISGSLLPAALPEFDAALRRMGTLLDFRVLDLQVSGRLRNQGARELYNSNPVLFRTLESSYLPLQEQSGSWPQRLHQLDLLVPRESFDAGGGAQRGYWRATLAPGEQTHSNPNVAPSARYVEVVQPARARLREMEQQSARALGSLSCIILIGACLAEAGARALEDQIPQASAGRSDSSSTLGSSDGPRRHRSRLLELETLRLALESREAKQRSLIQELQQSEQQRQTLQREVERLSILDPLTGCFNRQELDRRLQHELQRSKRDRKELSFAVIEIDHLRQIHQSYGSEVGDQVLRRVASELSHRSRISDWVCRFTADRFALVLPACNLLSAQKLAEQLKAAILEQELEHEGCHLSVTLSIGISSLRGEQDDTDSLINRAENALYRAKLEGRNRVVVL